MREFYLIQTQNPNGTWRVVYENYGWSFMSMRIMPTVANTIERWDRDRLRRLKKRRQYRVVRVREWPGRAREREVVKKFYRGPNVLPKA